MKKNNKYKLIIVILSIFLLTGCGDKSLKDENKKIVKNEQTGQVLKTDIICQPTDEESLKLYEKYDVDLSELPKCENFSPLNNYEGLWTSIFVKPLAWFIIQIGKLVKNYGLAVILSCLVIRLLLMPITKKTAVQSENMKKAQPELNKLEKKYANKNDQQSMMLKSQEMMLVYKKYQINPLTGCLFSFLQIPLFFAFLEAINRIPVIFEETFLGLFQLGTSPAMAVFSQGKFYYAIFIVLIAAATYYSFKINSASAMSSEQEQQMKSMTNMMVIFMTIAAFSISTGIAIYWTTSNLFTIVQNLLVKRGKKNVRSN